MTVTIYAPDAGGINGNGTMADGSRAHIGAAACGYQYDFGTVFELTEDMSEYGLPQLVECRDRGSFVGPRSLDLVLIGGPVQNDVSLARKFGRRKIGIRVWQDWDAYHAFHAQQTLGLHHIGQPGRNRYERQNSMRRVNTAAQTRRSRAMSPAA